MDGAPVAPLERDAEHRALREALVRAAAGTGGLVLVEGPAGIGKTTLLETARDDARDLGLRVLTARGGVLEADLHHGVVRQLFERAVLGTDAERRAGLLAGPAAPAAALFAGAATPADPGPLHDPALDLLHGLGWFVAHLADDGPLALVVDDAHWADPSSLRALVFLARRLDELPVVLLVGTREPEPGPAEAPLRELQALAGAAGLRPGLLSAAGVGAVLSRAFGGRDAPPELAAACLEATGGNPFFATELAAELAGSHDAPGDVRIAAVARTGPSAVRRSLLLRLGHLGPDARDVARALAVLGGEAPLGRVAGVAGLDAARTATAAGSLARAGLADAGIPVRLLHPLVRAAISEDTPAPERAAAHRRALEALTAEGATDEERVPHALGATPTGDPAVAGLLARTADRALRSGEPASAAVQLDRALAEPPASEDRAAVLAALGRAEVRSGLFADGIARLEQAVALTGDPTALVAAHRDRAFAAFAGRGMRVARATVKAAAEDLTARGAGDDALQLEADLALLAWLSGQPHGLELRRHDGLAGATRAERTVLALLAQDEHAAGAPAPVVVELAERALGGGRLIHEDSAEALHWYMATYALLTCEAHDAAARTIEEALADGRRRGSAFARAGALGTRAVLALNQGRPRDAEADALAAAGGAIPPVMVPVNAAYVVLALTDQGDLDGAERELVRGGLTAGPGGPTVMRWMPWARLRLREAQGRPEDVDADVAPLREDDEAGRPMRALAWRALQARVLARDGRADRARGLAEEHLAWARRWGRPAALGVALRASALAGGPEGRIDGLTDAVSILAGSDSRTEEARARTDLGIALLRAGRRRDGRAALEAALETALGCGARGVALVCADELAVAGAPAGRLRFDELTPSERRVAELASGGSTNREIAQELFVTPKTVENHLTRVYAKLGVHSRRALAGAL
ncbi:AAA family ATPase [Patulibacter sp.]|uniref:ATP-binding protein n=1 Tax=Patulibacter sp. TaxID=1912859 RepID=UPI0027266E70|nr:LuxR family transcriptional regulator [Patulibacter sp.]MDO9408275.1 AAA family ATPase [Patulibacter sp.]